MRIVSSCCRDLTRNGKALLEELTFGENCYGGPSVVQVSIRDGKEGWNARNMDIKILCKPRGIEFTKFMSEGSASITKAAPIDKGTVARFVAERTSENK